MNHSVAQKILVVDDSGSVRRDLSAALKDAGYVVVEADNGVTGLQRLDEQSGFRAIVSDIHMPCMDGLQMLESIKSRPEHRALPVLILTSEVQQDLIKTARRLGASAWLVKPVNPTRVVAAIRRLIGE